MRLLIMPIVSIVLAALLPALAAAETAYVTDNLRLRMYADQQLTSVLDTLESGDAFELVSREGQTALIELPDGTRGYVSAAYIVTEKPARLIVAETETELERVTAELDTLRSAFAEPAETIERLEAELAARTAEVVSAERRAETLETENATLARAREQHRYSLPYTWVGGAVVICLIAGFLLGLWWTDRQSRRRHGGIRVY